ncbi:hypothetical protein GCM10022248_37730 [Nonomuraea soli]
MRVGTLKTLSCTSYRPGLSVTRNASPSCPARLPLTTSRTSSISSPRPSALISELLARSGSGWYPKVGSPPISRCLEYRVGNQISMTVNAAATSRATPAHNAIQALVHHSPSTSPATTGGRSRA